MALTIKTNTAALMTRRQLDNSTNELKDSMGKLASGYRVNKSADDAAGLAVAERIRARVRSLGVAKRNASDAVSYVQTAEGALNEMSSLLIRMRELTSQAASDTIGNRERSFLDKEFQQIRQEVQRTVDITEFNGTKVLVPKEEADKIQIFVGASNRGVDVEGNIPEYDEGEDPDVLTIDMSLLNEVSESLETITQDEISIVPDSPDGGATELGGTGTSDLISRIDNSINTVSGMRATFGAFQSRIEATMRNIDVSSENLQAARSRIVDADYAAETARFTRAKILSQAGLSVQSHANTLPEMVVALLR